MSINLKQFLIPLSVIGLVVGMPLWMSLDRTPPYVREHGVISPTRPELCGFEKGQPAEAIYPGGCITVNWSIRVIRNCPPDRPSNITRHIQDSERVLWPIGPELGVFGTTKEAPKSLVRAFLIPSGARPGPALYKSTATFACNPLQRYFRPITISEPDVEFEIAIPPEFPRIKLQQYQRIRTR